MSDLYRSAIEARRSKLPYLPPLPSEDVEDDDDSEQPEEENDSLGSLPSMPPPGGFLLSPSSTANSHSASTPQSRRQTGRRGPNPEYAPMSAAGYFEQAVEVTVAASQLKFRVFYTPPVERGESKGTVMVLHHGAGYSALSFACMAKMVGKLTEGECGVLAMDARRHGNTQPLDESVSDANLSVDVLARDIYNLLCVLFPNPAEAPAFLLVGHSMGGSVLVRTCPMLLDSKYRITGVVVVDVVEGSAMEALPHMHHLLDSRPDGFNSLEEAIKWHVSNHTIRNATSARISVPSLFELTSGKGLPKFVWRTPLRSTAPYWTSWFLGLSKKFLEARTARLLVLAGTDRLDKELMVGQMMGKFQLVVVPGTGHMIQEDDPAKLAEVLIEFWRRNEKVIPGVKKVGES